MPRTLTVRWDDFEAAFFLGSPEARYFVNLESGEVVYTSHMDGETVRERVLRQTKQAPWIAIPRAPADQPLQEIRAFAAQVDDEDMKAAIMASLDASQTPRAFNAAIGTNVEVRRAWRAHLQRGIQQRLLAFCQSADLEIDDDRFRALVSEHS